jgi:transcriptional regulator with PAS, ATPase and Fis domain
VDRDDLVIGATRKARDVYGLTDADLQRPLTLAALEGRDPDLARDYAFSEHRIIQQSLAKSGGNVSAAAREMGISRATLHRKLKRMRDHAG